MKKEHWIIRDILYDDFDSLCMLDENTICKPTKVFYSERKRLHSYKEDACVNIIIKHQDVFTTKELAEEAYIKELEKRISIDQEEIRLAKQRLLK